MKWLPILLTLCGFNMGQSFQIAAMIESIWITGSFFAGRNLH